MRRLARESGESTADAAGVDCRQRGPDMRRNCPYLGRAQVTARAENALASRPR